MGIDVAFGLLVALLGASVGSFLNVVIYRLPHGLSLVRPASRCPACETPIKPWHNLPVVGWLLVRGRCAACGVKLSLRYPLIELIMGLLAVAIFHDVAGGPLLATHLTEGDFVVDVFAPFVAYLGFASLLVTITFIDLDWFIIPDGLSLTGLAVGLLASWSVGGVVGITWMDAVIGAALGAGLLIAVILGYAWMTGRQGMGGGDWKLLGLIGAWLGWQALPAVLLLASLQGILLALVLGRAFAVDELPADPTDPGDEGLVLAPTEGPTSLGQLAIPFGPFLSLGALEFFLFRSELTGLLASWFEGAL